MLCQKGSQGMPISKLKHAKIISVTGQWTEAEGGERDMRRGYTYNFCVSYPDFIKCMPFWATIIFLHFALFCINISDPYIFVGVP